MSSPLYSESFLRKIFYEPLPLAYIRQTMKKLQDSSHVILRESLQRQRKDRLKVLKTQKKTEKKASTTMAGMTISVKYICVENKCPYRLSFRSNASDRSNFILSALCMSHSHDPSSENSFLLKTLINEVQDQSEHLYKHYFESKVTPAATTGLPSTNSTTTPTHTTSPQSITFERPARLLADYENQYGFNVIANVKDNTIRVKLKKKFDNVIQVLRRRFQLQYPKINCIVDDSYSQRRSLIPEIAKHSLKEEEEILPHKARKQINLNKLCPIQNQQKILELNSTHTSSSLPKIEEEEQQDQRISSDSSKSHVEVEQQIKFEANENTISSMVAVPETHQQQQQQNMLYSNDYSCEDTNWPNSMTATAAHSPMNNNNIQQDQELQLLNSDCVSECSSDNQMKVISVDFSTISDFSVFFPFDAETIAYMNQKSQQSFDESCQTYLKQVEIQNRIFMRSQQQSPYFGWFLENREFI